MHPVPLICLQQPGFASKSNEILFSCSDGRLPQLAQTGAGNSQFAAIFVRFKQYFVRSLHKVHSILCV